MENNSTEHIKNDELRFIFDGVLKKITNSLNDQLNNGCKSEILNEESSHLAAILFNKFKIQFYTTMNLTYNMTNDMEKRYEYLDIASIHTVIRSCYETYLTFYYIYMMPNSFESDYKNIDCNDKELYKGIINLKILLYKYEGAIQTEKFKQTIQGYKTYDSINKIKSELNKSKIFNSLDIENKEKYLKDWRPSWNHIAKHTMLSEWNSKGQYNILSQYGHNSYNSLCQLNYYYQNLEKYQRDAINTHLFEFTSLFINDIFRLFHLEIEILTKDELSIINEFIILAQSSPNQNIL